MTNTQIETVNTAADKIKLVCSVFFLFAAIAVFYVLRGEAGWLRWLGFIVGLALATAMFFAAESGRRLIAFGRDAWREVRKVVWPTRKEALQTTAFVFTFAVIMAIFLWLTDKTLEWFLYDLVLGWRG